MYIPYHIIPMYLVPFPRLSVFNKEIYNIRYSLHSAACVERCWYRLILTCICKPVYKLHSLPLVAANDRTKQHKQDVGLWSNENKKEELPLR